MKKRKKKYTIGRGKREVLLFFHRIMAVTMVVCLVSVFCNSFITINTTNGTYSYVVSPFDKREVFEDSEVFYDLLYSNIEELTRMAVIKSQLETDGAYDSQKEINITAYANRTELIVDDSVTAYYALDDLVKWGNYGFDVQTVYGTWDELSAYFEPASKTSSVSVSMDETELIEEAEFTEEDAEEIGLEAKDGDLYAMEILVARYDTIDGKDLIECASSISEYEELKENLYKAATSLFDNYVEYTEYEDVYGDGSTNLKYCFQMMIDDTLIRYTNMEDVEKTSSIDDITAGISEYGKFIYFNPDKFQITTNTKINAQTMKATLNDYEYAFTDNSRVWIGVDTTYPVQDDFYVANNAFIQFMPYYWQTVGVGIGTFLLWIFIFILLTKYEGRKVRVLTEEENIHENDEPMKELPKRKSYEHELQPIDYMPLEIILGIGIILVMLLGLGGTALYHYAEPFGFKLQWIPVVFGVLTFILDVLFLGGYLSIVRRLKKHELLKHTFVYRIVKSGGDVVLKTYQNGGRMSRFWIPYVICFMMNLILILLGVGGIIAAIILDTIIGIYIYKDGLVRQKIVEGIEIIREGELTYQINTKELKGENLVLAEAVNSIGEGMRKAVVSSVKDERMKTDLITNVSHDIKTPLTSIINYVDLIKRENTGNENIKKYVGVLEVKAQRLKQLTDDLVEASKISSGNIALAIEKINFVELLYQSMGEFSEKFEEKRLTLITNVPEVPVYIEADSSRTWRVVENLFNNVYKYALDGTRVYIDVEETMGADKKELRFSVRNISAQPLNVNAEELTERFIRGDDSRGTEGSGLGLSIAKNLTEAQKGCFQVVLDGDLFKVIITFDQKENY
ncbi:MAG: HAMP domain-containing sensor histidine kinase [Eubacteriales bacterium]